MITSFFCIVRNWNQIQICLYERILQSIYLWKNEKYKLKQHAVYWSSNESHVPIVLNVSVSGGILKKGFFFPFWFHCFDSNNDTCNAFSMVGIVNMAAPKRVTKFSIKATKLNFALLCLYCFAPHILKNCTQIECKKNLQRCHCIDRVDISKHNNIWW